MQKLRDYWNERSSGQKAILATAFLASFLLVAGFGWLASRPNMSLLYGGLDAAQSGDVIAGIEQAGASYEIRGDSIWVDSRHRDRLRMELAAQGLPSAGGAGYELLDGMSGFGTTSQMFDAAYWRAKEGELARTVLALPNVKAARVHLAVENGRGYRRDVTGSASVTLTTNGQKITREQASALRYLVSSGVPGMQPDAVTVIDSQRGVVSASEETAGEDRAAQMKRNVERILEPHVGIGNAIVELNLDLITESELLTEQRFDPDQRALISQVTEETSDQSNSTGAGAVTAASNLPDGDAAEGEAEQSSRSENRQQANYEVSSMVREVTRQPGATRRLTVAVLVNGVAETNGGDETVLVPRPDSELEILRELVASAVGYDETRGDLITVKSLPFARLGNNGTAANASFLDRLELNTLARIAIIGIFALALAVLVLRPIMKNRANTQAPALLDDSIPPTPPVEAEIEPVQENPARESQLLPPGDPPRPQLSLPQGDPVARLRGMMRERHDESVKILSGWIDNKENAH
ncbi:flagellar basal-body MS-ring/collar protein FliF [Paracoccus sp. Z330]|uniref:Flagellar M-ring protein n=1 Tax=Paracoccus onchidii TaxID=3017813 RepID=A0ABT4ZHL4_9RHOB|nr:flagellar basal-body MS-ring/collar protein FliF [Paracoccus onchidii]MDB6178744.1 flagellar basal-body MS-ring/collar protein FliF [Paracoccus onchidii]